MFVAKDKIKSNIGEYFLYMFQIEDLLRACKFNKIIIESKLIAQYQTDDASKEDIKNWYFGLADLMTEEKLELRGHLSFLTHKMAEVYDFHLYLSQHPDYADYKNKYSDLKETLIDLKNKNPLAEK